MKPSSTAEIAHSDLLINKDGSIYHLGIPFGSLPDTIITVGDPERVDLVSRHFDSISFKVSKREFVTHIGRIGNLDIAVVSTGIGTDNIDIVFNELAALRYLNKDRKPVPNTKAPLRVIRIGTSGAIRPDIEPGHIVISEAAVGFDNLFHFYENASHMPDLMEALKGAIGIPFTPYYAKSGQVIKAMKLGDLTHYGTTATMPGFYAPQGRRVLLSPTFDLIGLLGKNAVLPFTNFEMETSGIYLLGGLLGFDCASISLIVANRATTKVLEDSDLHMERLIKSVISSL